MSAQSHGAVLIISLFCFLLQLLTGTGFSIALLITAGIIAGIYAIFAAGGLASAAGALNAILITNFLIIAVLLKFWLHEPMEQNLLAPQTTAIVMTIGFIGLLVGTWLHRLVPVPFPQLMPAIKESRMYLALMVVFLILGYGGYFMGIRPDLGGSGEIQTGGLLGVMRILGTFGPFAIVPTLFYIWARGSRHFMSHPLAIVVLVFSSAVGLFSTSKQGAMEPFVFYIAVCVIRYSIFDGRIWALTLSGLLVYTWIIYPFSQYVRFNGGREGGFTSRVSVIAEVLWETITNPTFRSVEQHKILEMQSGYLDSESLQAFGRFAMIGEADRLISATQKQHAFTGWETITWGFKMLAPRFLYQDKPIFASGNYLGQIAGDAPPSDVTTQWAYGIMANLYNAFAYWGVFWGSIIFFGSFFYCLRLVFGTLYVSRTLTGSNIWFLLVLAKFYHSIVENTVAGMVLEMIITPCIILFLYYAARYVCAFIPKTFNSPWLVNERLSLSSR